MDFRPDIDGLRAVAIVAVVGFHANIAWLSGGFVGVDVFFVISGYLITRTLWEESRSRGSVSLLSFWAKRVRRLVPAMALMIAVVLPLSYLVFLPLSWQYITGQALSATLYVSNIYFGARSDQYFADDATTSVFLHTWSLGIEEQFYLAWPVIVLCVTILARRLRLQTPRVPLLVSFALIAAASFTPDAGLGAGRRCDPRHPHHDAPPAPRTCYRCPWSVELRVAPVVHRRV